MNIEQLENILSSEPAFRIKQAKRAVFHNLIESWEQATDLPPALRARLQEEWPLGIKAEIIEEEDSAKALIKMQDGAKIETVLMRHGDRNTVCVSSQVGCPMACVFCATGKLGFTRNLEPGEIAAQVLFWARYLKKQEQRVDNVVFMGMGEPFLNYDNVLAAVRILNDPHGLGIGVRHISISTAGVLDGIKKFSDEKLQVNLAISLHAPQDELRKEIMPVAGKNYPVDKILETADDYIGKTGRKVMLEYVMIKGVNDSDDCARGLISLLKDRRLYMVNLIAYNPTGDFEASDEGRIKEFRNILEGAGLEVTQRKRFGRGLKGACGQLAGKN